MHPYLVATQAHPELKSRPTRPHPLFRSFIEAALKYKAAERLPVDLGDDYEYAIVTDPTGRSGFILSRDPVVTPDEYQALKAQAKASGVRGIITKTRQPGARQATEMTTATALF